MPSGNFVPMFKMGAALGRMFGEAMHLWFPHGINFSGDRWPIVPGIFNCNSKALWSNVSLIEFVAHIFIFLKWFCRWLCSSWCGRSLRSRNKNNIDLCDRVRDDRSNYSYHSNHDCCTDFQCCGRGAPAIHVRLDCHDQKIALSSRFHSFSCGLK